MDKEEFQKKYDNSILVCCTENSIKKVFNICDLMDLTASNSKQATAILIGEQTAKSPLFHVEQFLNDFYKEMEEEKKEVKMFEQRMNMCNKWVMEDNKKQSKEPTFNKGNKIMYTIKDSNSNTYPVSRLSERVYESKEHKTLFITDEEGTVTGIYKEK